jgi:hypothetical protein
MKSSNRQRTTIIVVIVALAASAAMGAFVGQFGSEGEGDDNEAVASPRPFIATPVVSPGVMPPFFGMESDREGSSVLWVNVW